MMLVLVLLLAFLTDNIPVLRNFVLLFLFYLTIIYLFNMCINKKTILNKGYRSVLLHTPRYLDVPCGHCWQCHLNRVSSIAFRIIQDVSYYNCPSCLVTLSYSSLFLPKLVYSDVDGFLHELSCWNREHVKKFLKRIRRKLNYYFGVTSDSFKYFLSCERGSADEYVSDSGKLRKATLRPHYHLFSYLLCGSDLQPVRPLPKDFDFSDFALENCSLIERFWHFLLNSEWYYGNVDLGYVCRDTITSVLYVCKYVCKDIDEPLFKIDKSRVVRLIDPEFDFQRDLWYIQSKPIDPFLDVDFDVKYRYNDVYYTPSSKRKKFPRPIQFESVLPRSMGSIDIGVSFFFDKSEDELISYLSGNKKVCLPSAKSSTLINLPSYYYRRLCKTIKYIPYGKHYLDTSVFPNGEHVSFKERCAVNHHRVVWDNVQGFHLVFSPSLKTQSVTSELGSIVKRFKYKNYVSNSLIAVRHYLSNPAEFFDCLGKYSLLPQSYHTSEYDGYLTTFDSKVLFESLTHSKVSFSDVAKALNYSILEYPNLLSQRHKCLFGFIKLVSVCQYYHAHLVHLSYDKVYHKNFYSVCSDNPDLFLTHFLN